MTLKQAIREIIFDDSLSDGEVIDAIVEELDKEHDEDNRYQRVNIVGGNTLQKNYEAIEAALGLRNNDLGGML